MNLLESFRIAVSSLGLNKMRAALTILGIVIGVGAVISLIGLGRGVEGYVAAQFEGLGANLLTITARRPSSGATTAVKALTTQDVTAIADPAVAPSINLVAAEYRVSATVVADAKSVNLTVSGVTPSYAEVNDWHPQGNASFITQEDVASGARVALLGTSTVSDLFGSSSFNPIGLTVQINGSMFTVIGVMEEQDAMGFADPNESVLVPIYTAQSRLDNARVAGGGYEVSEIQALVSSSEFIDQGTREIETYLANERGITDPDDADYAVSNRANVLQSVTQVTSLLTIFLSVVAGISLLVGGIGVMNIMLVSVSERTREIGLRKAIGAQATDILGQFLIESILLSLVGGALGIGLGWVIMMVAGQVVQDLELALSPDVVILATGVSSFIGVFFGLYPASRAASMRPIDALRYE